MRFLIIFISFIFCSCTNNKSKSNSNILIDTIAISQEDTSQNKILKSSITFHLEYDTTKTLLQNLYNGWTDTFSVDKQKFKLQFDTASNDHENFCIKQLKNGRWQKLFNLYLGGDEYGKADINNDGYIDFVKFYHARHYIYFYNPSAKTLIDTVCIMPEDNTLIDKEKFILYNYYEAMYGNTYQSSQLYTYRQRQPYFFYELLLITNDSTDIEKMNLYRFKNGKYSDTVFIKTIKSGQKLKFDYKKFWETHYKKLMGYSQQKVLRQQG